MGHIHLGRLPSSRRWRDVVTLIEAGGNAEAVAAASAIAAERDLARAADNAVLVETVRLLGLIPQAARSDDFVGALREIGIDVVGEMSLPALLQATQHAVDQFADERGSKSDFSEIATRVLVATLSDTLGPRLRSLFGPQSGDLQRHTAELAKGPEFSRLAQTFFGSLLKATLSYWLDRELSSQVGSGLAFSTARERDDFDASLQVYCAEASRIIKEFAPGWYGKTIFNDGTVRTDRASAFAGVAFKKITEELKRKRGGNG